MTSKVMPMGASSFNMETTRNPIKGRIMNCREMPVKRAFRFLNWRFIFLMSTVADMPNTRKKRRMDDVTSANSGMVCVAVVSGAQRSNKIG